MWDKDDPQQSLVSPSTIHFPTAVLKLLIHLCPLEQRPFTDQGDM